MPQNWFSSVINNNFGSRGRPALLRIGFNVCGCFQYLDCSTDADTNDVIFFLYEYSSKNSRCLRGTESWDIILSLYHVVLGVFLLLYVCTNSAQNWVSFANGVLQLRVSPLRSVSVKNFSGFGAPTS